MINDSILGAKINGRSNLTGTIQLVPRPSSKDIRFDLVFTGFSKARTQGVHSVVVLQNTTETQIQAQKSFILNSKGLTYSPAVAVAETHSATDQINSTLPGGFRRIAKQIAAKKVAEVQPQLDLAVAQTAAARVQQVLDARVEHRLAWTRLISKRLASSSRPGNANPIEFESRLFAIPPSPARCQEHIGRDEDCRPAKRLRRVDSDSSSPIA